MKKAKFAKLEMQMVYSKAYQSLNAPALKILGYVLLQQRWVKVPGGKRSKDRYELTNKDKVELMYATFKRSPFNMANATITRAIDMLLARGFIRIVSQGGMVKGHKTIYGYTDDWRTWEEGQICFSRKPFFARGFAAA